MYLTYLQLWLLSTVLEAMVMIFVSIQVPVAIMYVQLIQENVQVIQIILNVVMKFNAQLMENLEHIIFLVNVMVKVLVDIVQEELVY